jgi:hypothetical protein
MTEPQCLALPMVLKTALHHLQQSVDVLTLPFKGLLQIQTVLINLRAGLKDKRVKCLEMYP